MTDGIGGGPTREDYVPLVRAALEEDGAHEDITTRALVPANSIAHAVIRAREDGVVCGLTGVLATFREVSPRLVFTRMVEDGTAVRAGTDLCAVGGPARGIVEGERVALNVLGRLSGIATMTRQYVDAVAGTGVTIHHTRKTTPGLRFAELWAVRCGGGHPHRIGLHDAVLAKENHYRLSGLAMDRALRHAMESVPDGVHFGTEVETIGELCHALEAGVDLVLLDDFPPDQIRLAVEERDARGKGPDPQLEASGGITLENIREVAGTGVERISVGAITRSAPRMDVALDIVDQPRAT